MRTNVFLRFPYFREDAQDIERDLTNYMAKCNALAPIIQHLPENTRLVKVFGDGASLEAQRGSELLL